MLEFLIPLITAIGTLFKSIRFVHEGERGIRLRFGKAARSKDGLPRIIEPGFVLLIPFVDTLKRHHVRQQTLRLADQRIMLKDGLIFKVGAMVIFKVRDIYKALFEIDDLDNSVIDLCMSLLREKLQACSHTNLSDATKISDQLLEMVRTKAEEWGVEFIQFGLTDCAPTPETANLLNAEIGVEMKMAALDNACKRRKIEMTNMNPSLAAALVGIPLTTSVADERNLNPWPQKEKEGSTTSVTFKEGSDGD